MTESKGTASPVPCVLPVGRSPGGPSVVSRREADLGNQEAEGWPGACAPRCGAQSRLRPCAPRGQHGSMGVTGALGIGRPVE